MLCDHPAKTVVLETSLKLPKMYSDKFSAQFVIQNIFLQLPQINICFFLGFVLLHQVYTYGSKKTHLYKHEKQKNKDIL